MLALLALRNVFLSDSPYETLRVRRWLTVARGDGGDEVLNGRAPVRGRLPRVHTRCGIRSAFAVGVALLLVVARASAGDGVPAPPESQPATPNEKSWREEVVRLAEPLVDAEVVPGLVIGVYDHGRTEVIALGRTDGPDSVAPSGATLYEIGSISKVFTGILLADAVARGRMALDEPIQKYFPDGAVAPTHGDRSIT
ncbi:MAG: beta-lactamase family protein, partial [Planctomycetes bacterium]|nr:beta-lactamase family protein [Planctomycetota bacterium]